MVDYTWKITQGKPGLPWVIVNFRTGGFLLWWEDVGAKSPYPLLLPQLIFHLGCWRSVAASKGPCKGVGCRRLLHGMAADVRTLKSGCCWLVQSLDKPIVNAISMHRQLQPYCFYLHSLQPYLHTSSTVLLYLQLFYSCFTFYPF